MKTLVSDSWLAILMTAHESSREYVGHSYILSQAFETQQQQHAVLPMLQGPSMRCSMQPSRL